ncbi:hypothetical protein PCE1_000954 [Barthelona sp. PCE]
MKEVRSFLFLLILFCSSVCRSYYYVPPPIKKPTFACDGFPEMIHKRQLSLNEVKNALKDIKTVKCNTTHTFFIPLPPSAFVENHLLFDEVTAFVRHHHGVDESACEVSLNRITRGYDVSCYFLAHGKYDLSIFILHSFCFTYPVLEGRCSKINNAGFIKCSHSVQERYKSWYNELRSQSKSVSYTHILSIEETKNCLSANKVKTSRTCTFDDLTFDTSVYTSLLSTPMEGLEKKQIEEYNRVKPGGCRAVFPFQYPQNRIQLYNREKKCIVERYLHNKNIAYLSPSHGRQLQSLSFQRYNLDNMLDYNGNSITSQKLTYCPMDKTKMNNKEFKRNNQNFKHVWLNPTTVEPTSYNRFHDYDLVVFTTGHWEMMVRTLPSEVFGHIQKVLHNAMSKSDPPMLILGDPVTLKDRSPNHNQYYVTKTLQRSFLDLRTTCFKCVAYSNYEGLVRNFHFANKADDYHTGFEIILPVMDLFSKYFDILLNQSTTNDLFAQFSHESHISKGKSDQNLGSELFTMLKL